MYLLKTKMPDTCELPEKSVTGNIRKIGTDKFPFLFLVCI